MVTKGREIVSRGLAECPEQQALCFLQATVVGPFTHEEMFGGFMEILPSFFASNRAASPVVMAIPAVALDGASVMPSNRHFASLSAKKYVQALSVTQSAVNNPEEQDSDALLTAILLMAAWEV